MAKTKNKSIRASEDMWDRMDAKAAEYGINVNAAVVSAMNLWLRDGGEPEPVLDRPRAPLSPGRSKTTVVAARAGSLVSTPAGARMSAPRQDTYIKRLAPAPKGKK